MRQKLRLKLQEKYLIKYGKFSKVICEIEKKNKELEKKFCDLLSNSFEKLGFYELFENKDEIEYATKHVGAKDYKTVLQEKLQSKGEVKIEYITISETGPDHDKSFESEVRCEGIPLARGKGKSKKTAEMQAARKALEGVK